GEDDGDFSVRSAAFGCRHSRCVFVLAVGQVETLAKERNDVRQRANAGFVLHGAGCADFVGVAAGPDADGGLTQQRSAKVCCLGDRNTRWQPIPAGGVRHARRPSETSPQQKLGSPPLVCLAPRPSLLSPLWMELPGLSEKPHELSYALCFFGD